MSGSSPAFTAFARAVARVAGSDASVLLEGESGSGKGRAARALHALSPRRDGPLVEVGLSALAPTLIEAELFGHEEGAYTGAQRARTGRFRRAEGGTLVLDGVETLPDALQVKLLRAVQEHVVSPLGSEEDVPVDVRVIATAACDLRAEVDAGAFREDLYYRLAVVPLYVPSLRERREDLPQLIERRAAEIAARTGVARRPLAAPALERLLAHRWPGNVRELENALERVLILVPEDALARHGDAPGRPPVEAGELAFLDEATAGMAQKLAAEALAHGIAADELESALFELALREEHGDVSAAARRVGLSRRTFDYRHKRHAAGADDDGRDSAAQEVG
jgi:DNA-binding NtrC family response regulator